MKSFFEIFLLGIAVGAALVLIVLMFVDGLA